MAKKRPIAVEELGIVSERREMKVGGRQVPMTVKYIGHPSRPEVRMPDTEVFPQRGGRIAELPIIGPKEKGVLVGANFRVFLIDKPGQPAKVAKVPRSNMRSREFHTLEKFKTDKSHYTLLEKAVGAAKHKTTLWWEQEFKPDTSSSDTAGLMRIDFFEAKGEKNLAQYAFTSRERLEKVVEKVVGDTMSLWGEQIDMDIKPENWTVFRPGEREEYVLVDTDNISTFWRSYRSDEAYAKGKSIGSTVHQLFVRNLHLMREDPALLEHLKQAAQAIVEKEVDGPEKGDFRDGMEHGIRSQEEHLLKYEAGTYDIIQRMKRRAQR